MFITLSLQPENVDERLCDLYLVKSTFSNACETKHLFDIIMMNEGSIVGPMASSRFLYLRQGDPNFITCFDL